MLEKSFTSAVCSSRLIRRTSPSKTLGANEKKSHITSTLINDISPLSWNWKYFIALFRCQVGCFVSRTEKVFAWYDMKIITKKVRNVANLKVYEKGVEKIYYAAFCTSGKVKFARRESCHFMRLMQFDSKVVNSSVFVKGSNKTW